MNGTFNFHGPLMTIRSLTSETGGAYAKLCAVYPLNVGSSLHMYSGGNECFYIVKGKYEFALENKLINTAPGYAVLVPKVISHKFTIGVDDRKALIISPPNLENYFSQLNDLLHKGDVTWETESSVTRQYSQVSIANTNYWK